MALCVCVQVGHTHNQLDGSFGQMSRNVYGRQCGGTTARNILSFSSFEKVCRSYVSCCYGTHALMHICCADLFGNSGYQIRRHHQNSWRLGLQDVFTACATPVSVQGHPEQIQSAVPMLQRWKSNHGSPQRIRRRARAFW